MRRPEVGENLVQGVGTLLRQSDSRLPLTETLQLPDGTLAGTDVEAGQVALQVTLETDRQPFLDFVAKDLDLVDPTIARFPCRGVLQQQKMLDDPTRPAPE